MPKKKRQRQPGKDRSPLIAALVGLVAVVLTLSHLWSWSQAKPLPKAKLVSVTPQLSRLKGSGSHFLIHVDANGSRSKGYMKTYFGMGEPISGEVVDLRVEKGFVLTFYYADWTREFGSRLVTLLVLAVVGGGFVLWMRRRRRDEQERKAGDV